MAKVLENILINVSRMQSGRQIVEKLLDKLSHHSTELCGVRRGARGLGGCAAFLWRTVSVQIDKKKLLKTTVQQIYQKESHETAVTACCILVRINLQSVGGPAVGYFFRFFLPRDACINDKRGLCEAVVRCLSINQSIKNF